MGGNAVLRATSLGLALLMLVTAGTLAAAGSSQDGENAEETVFEERTTVGPGPASETVDAASDEPLESLYNELNAAWEVSQADAKDSHKLDAFQSLMADFLNQAVNIHPESSWTLKGVELYSEWCQQAADRRSRRDRNHQAALRMLTTARAYFEMIDAAPGEELQQAIAKMERKVH